ncbi:MAG: hypothetical protein KF878_27160 [Planctomycetes bacterium]|nr:hypothetical protein [Planctomycetota bacterium]
MDATRPPPERPDDEADDARAVDAASGGQVRCPYCHDALADGALAGTCERCGTAHHAGCFAEHGGCSTHGCGSTRASTAPVGAGPAALDFTPRTCGCCRRELPREALVARCTRCHTTLHVDCYDRMRACAPGAAGCGAAVEVLPHAQVVALEWQRVARSGALLCVLWAALWAIAWVRAHTFAEREVLTYAIAAGVAFFGLVALFARLRASRLAASAARPPRRVKAPDAKA